MLSYPDYANAEYCAPQKIGTPERHDELRKQMLAYCVSVSELDTLATVRIWEFSKGIRKA